MCLMSAEVAYSFGGLFSSHEPSAGFLREFPLSLVQVQPFAAARNFGLNLLNTATPLRTAVMRIAMGL